jgi:hypothetical protein
MAVKLKERKKNWGMELLEVAKNEEEKISSISH